MFVGSWLLEFRKDFSSSYAVRMRRRVLLTILWLVTDVLVYIGAYVLAYFARVGWILSTDLTLQSLLPPVLISATAWLFVMITMRNFGLTRSQRSLKTWAYITYACVIGMAAFALTFYFLQQGIFSRLLLLLGGIFSAIGVIAWHMIFDVIQRILLRTYPPTYPLLVVGTNREAQH